jgi:hypothetical protein
MTLVSKETFLCGVKLEKGDRMRGRKKERGREEMLKLNALFFNIRENIHCFLFVPVAWEYYLIFGL